MAAGDTERVLCDSTAKMKMEVWEITTNGAGATVIKSGLGRIKYVFAQVTEFVADAVTLIPLIEDDNQTVTVQNTGDLIVTANVLLLGF